MEEFFAWLARQVTVWNDAVNGVVWGIPMIILILGTGVYMSVRTGFFHLTKARHVFRETFLAIFNRKDVTKTKDKKAISQFQAMSTALASTIGTGNITGVAAAIAIGGPGAVFWMWVSAFFGMMTSYSENVLGIYFRRKNSDGEWAGGSMYILENGLRNKKGIRHLAKPLAVLFAVFCVLASFGIGNMAQINSISGAMHNAFRIPPLVTGVVLAVVAALVIMGGIKRIGSVTEKLVPFMALFYIVCCLTIFFLNAGQIPYVFESIFKSAFDFSAVAGAGSGLVIKKAMTMGFQRGIFSNEAGLGSGVMVNAASDVREPVKQGMWGIFEVFFDTIIVCTLTAFVLLSSVTGNLMTFDEALDGLSTDVRYVQISDNAESSGAVPLMDSRANPKIQLADGSQTEDSGTIHTVTPASGQPFTIQTQTGGRTEDSMIYTNIMAVRGIEKRDAQGEIVYADDNTPEIGGVEIQAVEGVPLVTYAFSEWFGPAAGKLLSVAVLLFAFSTVIGWSFYGTRAMEYLLGRRVAKVYQGIFVLFIVVGAVMELGLAFRLSDTFNGMMAIPNLIGVLLLSGVVIRITKNYKARRFGGADIEPILSAYPDIQAEQAARLEK